MLKTGTQYRTLTSVPVICWWYYDTVAILDDYSDCAPATLEAGTRFTIMEIPEKEPSRINCKVENDSELKRRVLPKDCQKRHWWSLPLMACVSFQVEIAAEVIEAQCAVIPDPPSNSV